MVFSLVAVLTNLHFYVKESQLRAVPSVRLRELTSQKVSCGQMF